MGILFYDLFARKNVLDLRGNDALTLLTRDTRSNNLPVAYIYVLQVITEIVHLPDHFGIKDVSYCFTPGIYKSYEKFNDPYL